MPFPGQQGSFDAEKVEPAGSMETIPAGLYPAYIVKSETKQTNAGTGSYLSLMFKILDGDYQNRTVWVNLNLDNPNPKAVEIAQRELSSICRAVNVLTPEEPEELNGRPLQIKVAIRPATAQWPESNDVKGFKGLSDDDREKYEEEMSAGGLGGAAVANDVDDDDIPF